MRLKSKLSEEEARIIIRQLTEGLKDIYGKNIIHWDLKPDNIMLCGRYRITNS